MTNQHVILGDWGTSRLRLVLHTLDRNTATPQNTVTSTVTGPGVKDVTDFPSTFLKAAASLPEHAPDTPVVLAGMVGSTIGWIDAGYVPCPAPWETLMRSGAQMTAGSYTITIAPGLSCTNRFGQPDVMRGEEIQLLGWSAHAKTHNPAGPCSPTSLAPTLLCLPGTHAKWAIASANGVDTFTTSAQGELYDILRRHSVLTRGADPAAIDQHTATTAFMQGVDLMRNAPDLSLSQALFTVRARQVTGDLDVHAAPSFLSGIVIGCDVRDIAPAMRRAFAIEEPVAIIGDATLTALYALAFERNAIPCTQICGQDMVLAGLTAFHRSISQLDGETL